MSRTWARGLVLGSLAWTMSVSVAVCAVPASGNPEAGPASDWQQELERAREKRPEATEGSSTSLWTPLLRTEPVTPARLREAEERARHAGLDDAALGEALLELGALYLPQGRVADAKAVIERALGVYERRFGEASAETARCYAMLAWLRQSEGKLVEAEQLLQRALEIRESRLGAQDPEIAESLAALADVEARLGRLDRAVEHAERAASMLGTPGREGMLAGAHILLGRLYRVSGRTSDAHRVLLLAQEGAKRAQGARSLLHSETRVALAELELATARLGVAEKLLVEVLELRAELLGAESIEQILPLDLLVIVHARIGDLEKARKRREQSVAIVEKAHGLQSIQLAAQLRSLVAIELVGKRFDQAVLQAERLVGTFRGASPKDPAALADGLEILGVAWLFSGDAAAADRHFAEAQRILSEALGAAAPVVAAQQLRCARRFYVKSEWKRGDACYERFAAGVRGALGTDADRVIGATLAADARDAQNRGEAAGALALYERADRALAAAGPSAREERIEVLGARAFLQWEKSPEAARADIDAALRLAGEIGPAAPVKARVLIGRAALETRAEQWPRAEASLLEALAIAEQLDAKSPERAGVLAELGSFHRRRRDFEKARDYYARAVVATETQVGGSDPRLAIALVDSGKAIRMTGRLDEAEAAIDRALEILGDRSSYERTRALIERAAIHGMRGQHAQAEPLLREVLVLREQHHGEDSLEVASALEHLGSHYRATNRLPETATVERRALAIREAKSNPGDPAIDELRIRLARVLAQLGEAEQARAMAIAGADGLRKTMGSDHPLLVASLNEVGWLLVEQGYFDDAERYLRQALQVGERTLGPRDAALVLPLVGLADVEFHGRENFAESLRLAERAVAIARAAPAGREDAGLERALGAQGRALVLERRVDEAIPLFAEALQRAEARVGPDHPEVENPAQHLGKAYLGKGRYAEAEPLLERAHRLALRTRGPSDRWTQQAADDLRVARLGKTDPAAAHRMGPRASIERRQVMVLLEEAVEAMQTRDWTQAEESLREAVAAEEQHDQASETMALLHANLIFVNAMSGDFDDVQRSAERVQTMVSDRLALSLQTRGRLAVAALRWESQAPQDAQARQLADTALGLVGDKPGRDFAPLARDVVLTVVEAREEGNMDGAERMCERAFALALTALADEPLDVAASYNTCGYLYMELGRHAEAERNYIPALNVYEAMPDPGQHEAFGRLLHNMGQLYYSLGRFDRAEPLLVRTIKVYRRTIQPRDPRLASAMETLVAAQIQLQDYASAEVTFSKLIELSLQANGAEHPRTKLLLSQRESFREQVRALPSSQPSPRAPTSRPAGSP